MNKNKSERRSQVLRMNRKNKEKPLIINIVTQMEAGGAQKVAITLTEQFINRGYASETWFLYMKRPAFQNFPHQRILLSHRPKYVWDFLLIFLKLICWLGKRKPHAVITFTHYANILGGVAAWIIKVPKIIATQHSPEYSHPFIARILDRVLGSIGFYSRIVMVSGSLRSTFSHNPNAYLNRSLVIYNGIVDSTFGTHKEKEQIRKQFELPVRNFLLINVGRLAPPKNQNLLLMAMALLKKNGATNISLVILGEGELRNQLTQKCGELDIQDAVYFLGELPSNEVIQLLRASDLFVFPSIYEGFGNVLVEAFASGLPILASDIPTNREVLGEQGMFLSPYDPVAWMEAILRLREDEVLRKQLSELSKERAKLFGVDKMTNEYLRLLFEAESQE